MGMFIVVAPKGVGWGFYPCSWWHLVGMAACCLIHCQTHCCNVWGRGCILCVLSHGCLLPGLGCALHLGCLLSLEGLAKWCLATAMNFLTFV